MKNALGNPIKDISKKDNAPQKNEKENEQQKSFIFASDIKSNDIALNIVKISKYIFEKIALSIEDKEQLVKSLDKIKIKIKDKEFRDFNLDLYDEHFNYYNDLQKYFVAIFEYCNIPSYFDSYVLKNIKKSYISIYNLSILLDLLIELLEKNPAAHEDKILN